MRAERLRSCSPLQLCSLACARSARGTPIKGKTRRVRRHVRAVDDGLARARPRQRLARSAHAHVVTRLGAKRVRRLQLSLVEQKRPQRALVRSLAAQRRRRRRRRRRRWSRACQRARARQRPGRRVCGGGRHVAMRFVVIAQCCCCCRRTAAGGWRRRPGGSGAPAGATRGHDRSGKGKREATARIDGTRCWPTTTKGTTNQPAKRETFSTTATRPRPAGRLACARCTARCAWPPPPRQRARQGCERGGACRARRGVHACRRGRAGCGARDARRLARPGGATCRRRRRRGRGAQHGARPPSACCAVLPKRALAVRRPAPRRPARAAAAVRAVVVSPLRAAVRCARLRRAAALGDAHRGVVLALHAHARHR
jgi:hypothetical protein